MPAGITNLDIAQRLTRLEEGQRAMNEKLDLHHENLKLQLTPLLELKKEVKEHDRQINRWQGANAVIAAVVSSVIYVLVKMHLWRS